MCMWAVGSARSAAYHWSAVRQPASSGFACGCAWQTTPRWTRLRARWPVSRPECMWTARGSIFYCRYSVLVLRRGMTASIGVVVGTASVDLLPYLPLWTCTSRKFCWKPINKKGEIVNCHRPPPSPYHLLSYKCDLPVRDKPSPV